MYQLTEDRYLCGYLVVPENYAKIDSKNIKVPFLVILPEQHLIDSSLEPVLVTGGGGPGSPQLGNQHDDIQDNEFWMYEEFSVNDGRNLIILDNRGTGLSEPDLECHYQPEVLQQEYWDEIIKADFFCGTQYLNNGIDLSQYNVVNAAMDIEMFRQLYEKHGVNTKQINLYGISYGTHLAMTYERMFPHATRTLVLDSVVANEQNAITYIDRQYEYGQRALDLVFARCISSSPCNDTFGSDLEAEFYTFLGNINSTDLLLEVDWPDGTGSITIPLSGSLVVSTLHSALYSGETIASVPLIIRDMIDGSFETFTARLNSDLESYSSKYAFSDTAFLTYLCFDQDFSIKDGRYFPEDKLFKYWDQEKNRLHMQRVCSQYRIAANSDWHSVPYSSDTPALLLSGNLDPVTPPASASKVTSNYNYHWNIVLEDLSHDLMSHSGCARLLASWFIYHPQEDLDGRLEECDPEENTIDFQLQ